MDGYPQMQEVISFQKDQKEKSKTSHGARAHGVCSLFTITANCITPWCLFDPIKLTSLC